MTETKPKPISLSEVSTETLSQLYLISAIGKALVKKGILSTKEISDEFDFLVSNSLSENSDPGVDGLKTKIFVLHEAIQRW